MPFVPGVTLLSLLFLGTADSASVTVRRVVFTCANADLCAVTGTLLIDGTVVPLRNGVADVSADGGSVELRADGYWMPPQPLASELRVWRTALVRGRFTGSELPSTFKARFSSPPMAPEPRVPADSEVECPVGDDGAWTCALPATMLDVALRAKGFTPHYLWDVKVPTNPIGPVTLQRGASFVAWIDRRVAAALKKPATARVLRQSMPDASPLGQRLAEPVAEAAFNKRGMVQLAPIPPGLYTIEISAPGFATTRLENIEIYERSESTLKRVIELQPPVTIQLTLQPAVDPSGAPWIVDLHRFDPITRKPARVRGGAFREPGIFEVRDQSPGRYSVTVKDARGNDYASADLTITGDADAQQTLEMTLARIAGVVMLGDEPIAAKLLFGGNGGAEKIRATADDDGRFEITLPRSGVWKIDVESEADEVDAVVELSIEKDQRELTITLPDTEVAGWVVDSTGARLPKASVVMHTSTGTAMKSTAADGTFRFRGVADGAAKITAANDATREYSRMRELTVSEGEHLANIELVIQSASDLAGIVICNGQPLAGARVLGYGYVDGMARQEKAVTALDGSFKLPFPDEAGEIVLLVAAAGRTMQGFTITGRPRSTTLDLAAVGGTVRLQWGEKANPLLYYNGTLLPRNDVFLWARSHGHSIANRAIDIPHLAPGSYRLCDGAKCVDGVLAARGTLTLDVTSAPPSTSP